MYGRMDVRTDVQSYNAVSMSRHSSAETKTNMRLEMLFLVLMQSIDFQCMKCWSSFGVFLPTSPA